VLSTLAVEVALLLACEKPLRERDEPLVPAPQPSRPSERLRLATWNVEWLSGTVGSGAVPRTVADYARLRDHALRLDADVIALQEVENRAAVARLLNPDEYQVLLSEGGREQRIALAYRRSVRVTDHREFAALDVGDVRPGLDVTVALGQRSLRLLVVHLKARCPSQPLESGRPCATLARQLPILESWIDARAREGVPFAVLGDFNRRFFATADEPFWRDIDDADPAEADLWSPTEGVKAGCNQRYPDFVDHIVLSRTARALMVPGSFSELLYDRRDSATLSDHCPLVLTLSTAPGDFHHEKVPPLASAPEDAGAVHGRGSVKGNINGRGARIYHLPGCNSYENTVVDEAKGERWFRTEQEAADAGWLKATNCQ
jgi:endonuclease/exonuclease/phosphatase family metal-dependent hydrolase